MVKICAATAASARQSRTTIRPVLHPPTASSTFDNNLVVYPKLFLIFREDLCYPMEISEDISDQVCPENKYPQLIGFK